MLDGVLPPSYVQRVAVGQERYAALLPHDVGYDLRIVRPEERQVAVLPEVDLESYELLFHVYVADARGTDHALQLHQEAVADFAAHIREEHFGLDHEASIDKHLIIICGRSKVPTKDLFDPYATLDMPYYLCRNTVVKTAGVDLKYGIIMLYSRLVRGD